MQQVNRDVSVFCKLHTRFLRGEGKIENFGGCVSVKRGAKKNLFCNLLAN
jgi:hypothetical protein